MARFNHSACDFTGVCNHWGIVGAVNSNGQVLTDVRVAVIDDVGIDVDGDRFTRFQRLRGWFGVIECEGPAAVSVNVERPVRVFNAGRRIARVKRKAQRCIIR